MNEMQDIRERVAKAETRLDNIEKNMDGLSESLKENTKAVNDLKEVMNDYKHVSQKQIELLEIRIRTEENETKDIKSTKREIMTDTIKKIIKFLIAGMVGYYFLK